jgi:hypothetical protein
LVWRIFLTGGFAFFCFLYGAAFALLAPFMAVPLVGLLVPLVLLVIWTVPEIAKPPVRLLETLFFAYFAVTLTWPGYLAIALPGLPWITPQRLFEMPLAVTLLICLFGSRTVRTRLSSVLAAAPWIRNLFFAFITLQAISLAFSATPSSSIGQLVNAQTRWTAIFLAACLVFAKEGRAERMAALLCMVGVFAGLIGIWEFRLGQLPWVGHIPSFLRVDNASVAAALAGADRGSVHRVQSTFGVAQGFGEFLAIVFPFVLHFAANAHRWIVRIAAFVAVPSFVLFVMLSQARIGYVGYFITVVAYPVLWAVYHWRRGKNLFVSAIVYLSPALVAIALVALFTIDGIRMRVFGGGALQVSTQARYDQLDMGIPKILSHPWGYGIGRGAQVLGFYTPGGQLTVDSYWLLLALDYGVIGLGIWLALFCSGIAYAGRGIFLSTGQGREKALFLPIGVALLNYLVIKSTYAEEDGQTIIFALFGMLCALGFRFPVLAEKRLSPERGKSQQDPAHPPQASAAFS